MPIYEYQCPKCEKVHEVMQKFSDAPLAICPDCSGPVTKIMSMTSFALKGSGWYTTDYKRKGQNPGQGSGAATTEGGSTGKSEATPTAASATSAVATPTPAVTPKKASDSKS